MWTISTSRSSGARAHEGVDQLERLAAGVREDHAVARLDELSASSADVTFFA